ncbi:MAG: hypothetical protein QW666_02800 [Candidatus Woesearchaeota archaeon]
MVVLALTVIAGTAYILFFWGSSSISEDPVKINAKEMEGNATAENLEELSKAANPLASKINFKYFKYFYIKCTECDITPDLSQCYEKLEANKNNPELLNAINAINLDMSKISKIEKKYRNGDWSCFYYQYI